MKLPTSPFLQDKFFSDSNHSVEFLCVTGSALAVMQEHFIMSPKKKKTLTEQNDVTQLQGMKDN